jgi:hypothetical protein
MCNDDGEPMKRGRFRTTPISSSEPDGDLPYRHSAQGGDTKTLDRFANKGRSMVKATRRIRRCAAMRGRSSNKVLKNVIKKGDIKKENGSISAPKMESTGTVNMYLDSGRKWYFAGADLREEREPTRCIREWVIDGSQMDGTGDLKMVGSLCWDSTRVYHRGSLCEVVAERKPKGLLKGRINSWQVPRLSVTQKVNYILLNYIFYTIYFLLYMTQKIHNTLTGWV